MPLGSPSLNFKFDPSQLVICFNNNPDTKQTHSSDPAILHPRVVIYTSLYTGHQAGITLDFTTAPTGGSSGNKKEPLKGV